MAHPLRARSTPRALAESRQVIDFEGYLSDFGRLAEIVEADLQTLAEADRPAHWRQAAVSVGLSFAFADLRETLPTVTGKASVTLDAVCQRCLQAFALPLKVELQHVLLAIGEKHDGYEGYEGWELSEAALRPLELVEEALVMALPLSAAHPSLELCGRLAGMLGDSDMAAGETVRPFAGLKAQLDESK